MEKIEVALNAWNAWRFLKSHYIFRDEEGSVLAKCLDCDLREVNPATCAVDDDPAKNTAVRWFFKCSMWCRAKDNGLGEPLAVPVPELNCDAATFEEAIVKLANLVRDRYGDPN